MTWRERSRAIIARVLAKLQRGLKKPKQRAFRRAVPVDPNQERMF